MNSPRNNAVFPAALLNDDHLQETQFYWSIELVTSQDLNGAVRQIPRSVGLRKHKTD